jgi:hypothetical protein
MVIAKRARKGKLINSFETYYGFVNERNQFDSKEFNIDYNNTTYGINLQNFRDRFYCYPLPKTYKHIIQLSTPAYQWYSSSCPVLGLLRPVTYVTKLNLSFFSEVFLNIFSLLVDILESFLGSCESSSCQHALSNFSYIPTDI